MQPLSSLEMRSLITAEGQLKLWLEEVAVREPADDELVVRVEAAPINPSDQLLMFGPADPSTLREVGTPSRPIIEGTVPHECLAGVAGRLDKALPVGNEGAGTVVAAGRNAQALIGKTVAVRVTATGATYTQYLIINAKDVLMLPDDMSPATGAAAFINPLTALGMVETMRRENHTAIVHTAAASNLGQMLNRLALKDGIPLVNIVRSQQQAKLLKEQGAQYIVDSSRPDFKDALTHAIEQTNATLAFDAISGGTMASTILECMETVQARKLTYYSRYGSPVHKHIYIYGVLDPGPRIIQGAVGTAWSVSGWLMSWFYEKIGAESAARLRQRVVDEMGSTFASQYTAQVSLHEALSLKAISAYSRKATGDKYLIEPRGVF